MARTDITAINAKSISVAGVPVAGSPAPSGQWTTFDQLDGDAVVALNGVPIQGALPPGAVYSNYDNINVLSGLSQADVLRYGTASTPATNAATGPITAAGQGTPTPGPTPLPSGIVAMWDAASITGAADGTAISSWTDTIASIAATPTSDSGANRFTYVADSGGGRPAVRCAGNAVYETTGTNAAQTALSNASQRGIIVVARRFLGAGSGQANPVIVAFGPNANNLLQATPTQTGMFPSGSMAPCADPGIRILGYGGWQGTNDAGGIFSANATAMSYGNAVGGQVYIGGWKNVAAQSCGTADILAIIVLNRAATAADFKQVRRRYCDLTGEAYPAGNNVTVSGDSLTVGNGDGIASHIGYIMAQQYGWAWGTWDSIGVQGWTWAKMLDTQVPLMGNIAAATGRAAIFPAFEFANATGSDIPTITTQAKAWISGVLTACPGAKIVMGTSTDDGRTSGVATRDKRTAWNASVTVANFPGITTVAPLHTNPNIGVIGSAPTNGVGNTYFKSDGLHFELAGYQELATSSTGFGPYLTPLR